MSTPPRPEPPAAQRLSLARWVFRTGAVLFAVALVLVLTTAARIWWVARQDDRRPADALVVLGASQFNGRPSEIYAARLDHAAELFRAGVAPRVLTLGGGRPGDRTTEGDAGADYLARQGIPRAALIAVPTGNDTFSSLRAARDLLAARGWRRVVLVTDPWHVLRSRTIARDLGLSAVASPVRRGPVVRSRHTEVRYIWRETLGFLYFRLTGGGGGGVKGPPAA